MTYKIQINDEIRNATADEAALIEAQRAEATDMAAAADAKAAALTSARAKLAALGLTADEIAAFLG
jgi:hypothetical protein